MKTAIKNLIKKLSDKVNKKKDNARYFLVSFSVKIDGNVGFGSSYLKFD